jgi:hypothetical protein
MEFRIPASITSEDLVEEMYYEDQAEVLDFIKALDRRWGECEFTLNVLNHFADALRREGYTINLEIKEP